MKKIPGLGIIIVAGGSSTRYGKGNKLFENLAGLPVFLHSVKNFLPLAEEGFLLLVIPAGEKENFRRLLQEYFPDRNIPLVIGGSTRTESVLNGLRALPPSTQIAAIHDAARPLAKPALLRDLAEMVQNTGCGAIAAEKMIDSVCRTDADGKILDNVPREDLWRIQTPQVFRYSDICAAYTRLSGETLTDDSAAARACGFPVKVLNNPDPNLKLTLPGDLFLLEQLIKNCDCPQAYRGLKPDFRK